MADIDDNATPEEYDAAVRVLGDAAFIAIIHYADRLGRRVTEVAVSHAGHTDRCALAEYPDAAGSTLASRVEMVAEAARHIADREPGAFPILRRDA